MKKGFTIIEFAVVVAIIGIIVTIVLVALTENKSTPKPQGTETQVANEIQKDLVASVPVPQLQSSSERANVAKRAELFNQEGKISYIYLVNYGKVMAFYTVTGKVSSLRSYMTPVDKLVRPDGSDCKKYDTTCFVVESADIDGTYGENVDGIFFFTTDGVYVEWRGDYMMSDQPLKLTTQPELVRTIK